MKTILALILAVSASSAFAQTIKCPIGNFLLNGDTADVAYNPGFQFEKDTAYFIYLNNENSYYRLSNWGTMLTIPNALIDRKVATATVLFSGDGADQSQTCSVE